MDSKAQKHADSLAKAACKQQGGAFRDQGPMSTDGKGSLKDSGSPASSEHTSHDNAMCKQGGAGRQIKSIGS
jgi:threonine aldolase